MAKNLIIIGAGPGLSNSIAEIFGKEGFRVGLISRKAEKLEKIVSALEDKGVTASCATADAGDKKELTEAIDELRERMGKLTCLVYNAAVLKKKNILEESTEQLHEDLSLSAINAQHAVKHVLSDLKQNKGSVLMTGGGLALDPNPEMGSVCLGKALLRNLTFQLNKALDKDGVFAGIVTVCDQIREESETYSPHIIAQKFWQLHQNRSKPEIQH